MVASSHTISSPPLQMAADAEVSDWIEALAAQECTQDEFVREILRFQQEDADAGWEALALLDQQYRRQKISHEVFMELKARLHQHLVRADVKAPRPPAPQSAPPIAASQQPAPEPPPEPLPATAGTAQPMTAIREVALLDIPVITTAMEPAQPAGLIEVPFHTEVRVGDKLCDRYRVVEIRRRSSMGTLVEAIDEMKIELPGVRKRVAIQITEEALARNQAFLQRIGKLQSLSHPAIARLFDVEENNGALLLVMELLSGPSLQDLLARADGGALHITVAQSALRAVASALVYAHSQDVTHGDVSAVNVIITQSGDFRLQGFETQDPGSLADVASDRMAFARLAYQMLSGPQALHTQLDGSLRLRAPRGLAREQWRALRNTLKRKSGSHDVLAAFSGDSPRSSLSGWGAAICVTAVLGVAGYFYASASSEAITPPPAAEQSTAVVAPDPEPAESPPTASNTVADAPGDVATVAVGRAVIDMPAGTTTVDGASPVAHVWIRRNGNLKGAVTFKWWTESGTAVVDRDYRSIPARVEFIPAGAKGIEVLVPLVPGAPRRETRTFWVKIDEPGRGATLGSRTLTQVEIAPRGDRG